MQEATDPSGMVTYQFEIDDDEWDEWKNTVPRTKALDERIRELIRADAEGRVRDREPEGERGIAARSAANVRDRLSEDAQEVTARGHEHVDDARRIVHELDLPGSVEVQQRREAGVLELYLHLMENEGEVVETQQLKQQIDPDDVDYASVASFWSNCLKSSGDRPNALAALPGVQELGNGRYRYDEPEADDA